jgi:hypothetical protein
LIKQFGQHFAVRDILVRHERRSQLASSANGGRQRLLSGAYAAISITRSAPRHHSVHLVQEFAGNVSVRTSQ